MSAAGDTSAFDHAWAAQGRVLPRPPFTGYRRERGTPTVVVGGAKGGVGTSAVAALMGGAAARRGHRVLLVDGDPQRADLHLLLGVDPEFTLDDVGVGGISAADIAVPVVDGLWLSPGAVESERMHASGSLERARLFHEVAQTFAAFDFVIVDGGTVADDIVRICTMAGTQLVLVTVPEPAALLHSLRLANLACSTVGLPVGALVNRVGSDREGSAVLASLHAAGERYLECDLEVMGWLPEDPAMRSAVSNANPLLATAGHSAIAQRVDQLMNARPERFGFLPMTSAVSQGAKV